MTHVVPPLAEGDSVVWWTKGCNHIDVKVSPKPHEPGSPRPFTGKYSQKDRNAAEFLEGQKVRDQMRMDLLLQKAKISFAESLQQSLKTIDPRLFKIAWTTLS